MLGPRLIALSKNHLNQGFPRIQTLRIGSDGAPANLLGVLPAIVPGIESGEQQLGVHGFRIERDRLLQFVFHGSALGGITHFHQGEGFVKQRFIGGQFQRAMNLRQGNLFLSAPGRDAGKQSVNIGIVRLRRHGRRGLRLGVVNLISGQQHISQIDPRLHVRRLQAYRLQEFAVGGAE